MVVSTTAINYHELTHAVAFSGGIRGPAPFQEGLAEAFNDGLDLDTPRAAIQDVLTGFKYDDPGYYTMGLFVRFLIERHDLATFLDFMRMANDRDDYSEFAPLYEIAFEEPLELAMTDFAEYPSCTEWNNRYAPLECEALPLEPQSDGRWNISVELDCGSDDVVGPMAVEDGHMAMWTQRAFEIEEDGEYVLILVGSLGDWGGARITRCGSCWDAFEFNRYPQAPDGPWRSEYLTAGRYHVLFVKDHDRPGPFGLVIARQP
jgi:hypothetical protein